MSGWKPKDKSINIEVIDVVNEFWWIGFNQSTRLNHVIESLAKEVLELRKDQVESEQQIGYLLKLLDELGKFPDELSKKAAMGNEVETFKAFNNYVRYVMETAKKRFDIME